MTENREKKSGKVLGSYQKVRTKFVPPMLQQFKFDYVSWSIQTMPELVWWDVLADQVSQRFAASVAEEIAEFFRAKTPQDHWWSFISDYAQLSDNAVNELKDHLSKANILSEMAGSLNHFLELYPECPLSPLLGFRSTGILDVSYLVRFEDRLRELEDKRSKSGVFAQANAVYLAFLLGRIHVKKGLALADFHEVEHYPDTEKSQVVGAEICAVVNMLAGMNLPKYAEDVWVQYFWRRSLELRPLNFQQLEAQ